MQTVLTQINTGPDLDPKCLTMMVFQKDFFFEKVDFHTLNRELVDTNAYKLQPSVSERVIVDGHCCHTALNFGVKAKKNQDKVPTLYWLLKLHKTI